MTEKGNEKTVQRDAMIFEPKSQTPHPASYTMAQGPEDDVQEPGTTSVIASVDDYTSPSWSIIVVCLSL